MTKHTPLPWRSEEVADTGGEECMPICEILSGDGATRQALVAEHVHGPDAELIVRAVNSHADLLAALRECARELRAMTDCESDYETRRIVTRAEAAIAKAESR